MPEINLLAVLVAATSSFVLGGAWYSPALFLNAWNRASGVNPKPEGEHPKSTFAFAFAFALVAAFAFAILLGAEPPLVVALEKGLLVGVGLVAASFGINYQFGGKSWALWGIDAGYHVAQFLVFGLVLGLWH